MFFVILVCNPTAPTVEPLAAFGAPVCCSEEYSVLPDVFSPALAGGEYLCGGDFEASNLVVLSRSISWMFCTLFNVLSLACSNVSMSISLESCILMRLAPTCDPTNIWEPLFT